MTLQLEQQLQRHLDYLQQDPQNYHLLLTISEDYRQLNQLELVEQYYLLSQVAKARHYQKQQESDKAMAILEDLYESNNDNAECNGLLALLYFDANQIERSLYFCQRALALNNQQLEAKIVRLLLKTLDNEASLSELRQQLDETPNECRLWFALGTVAMKELDYLAANDAFLKAIAIWPDFYEAWVYSGWCHLLQNNAQKAKAAWQQAIHLDTNKAEGWAGLALINALQGNTARAKQYLAQSREHDEQCFLISITEMILLNKHAPEKAAKLLQNLVPNLASQMDELCSQLNLTPSNASLETIINS